MQAELRKPAVSGMFYPSDPAELKQLLQNLESRALLSPGAFDDKILVGGIVPHAGYMYSGVHAIPFFHTVAANPSDFDTIVILNPDHHGQGEDVSLDPHSYWETPLGVAEIDKAFFPLLELETSLLAQQNEHSAEVMVPLLQYYMPGSFKILPVSIRNQTPDIAVQLAGKLAQAADKLGKRILVIASSDFSHFVPAKEGAANDNKVIEKIQALDTKEVYSVIMEHGNSVCGVGPIMTLLAYAQLKASKPRVDILSRGHSGERSSSPSVVHYLTAVVSYNRT